MKEKLVETIVLDNGIEYEIIPKTGVDKKIYQTGYLKTLISRYVKQKKGNMIENKTNLKKYYMENSPIRIGTN